MAAPETLSEPVPEMAGTAHGSGFGRTAHGLAVGTVLSLLKAYKVLVSPLFTGACRFTPSCSEYMAEAVTRHGVLKGGWLGLVRLSRCHPLGGYGVDPVPAKAPGTELWALGRKPRA